MLTFAQDDRRAFSLGLKWRLKVKKDLPDALRG
jgi:hypothetical protein